MNNSCRARDFLYNLVGPLWQNPSRPELKKPSTRTHRPLGWGDKRFSLKPGADSRYYLTSEYRRSEAHIILRELRDMVSKNSLQHFNHPDLQLSRIRKDETDVRSFVELIKTAEPWWNRVGQLVYCILAPQDIAKDLLKNYKVGKEAYREDRLEKEQPMVNFHDKMKKESLMTFLNINKKQAGYKAKGNQVIVKADRNLFGRMHDHHCSQQSAIHYRGLARPLGPIPWSLRKTNRAGENCVTSRFQSEAFSLYHW